MQKNSQWKRLSTQTLTNDPAMLRFEEPGLLGAEAAQVRFSANGVLLYTEHLPCKQNSSGIKVEVFPNPATSFFTILATTAGRFTLSDLNGRALLGGNLKEGRNEVKPSALPPGNYQLRFTPANGSPQNTIRVQLLP